MRRLLPLVLLAVLTLAACQPERLPVQGDLHDLDVTLFDADSNAVAFPAVLEDAVSIVGFIYTYCPDVCPMTTNTMRQVRAALDDSTGLAGTRFISVSFDPARDTPSVMDRYRRAYGLEDVDWLFLTGDSASVAETMAAFDVRYALSEESPPASSGAYLLNHSDQISLVDERLRLRMEYGGSMTPAELIVEDAAYLLGH